MCVSSGRAQNLPRLLAVLAGSICGWLSLAAQSPWPEIDSDLPPDAQLVEGSLPNGLRYAILPNAEPRDRIVLRLLVATGSLHERADEKGLAHFVEHMLFRGTRSHPGDSLVKQLEKRGIGQGPDSNAFTNYDHTIYHLDLPDTGDDTLKLGLRVFREYAEEAVFESKAVEIERHVILNEKAMRDRPDYRIGLANLEFLWPGSRQVSRPPIGSETIIGTCTREQLVSFYDAWYRPERMAVIVVGPVRPVEVAKLIADAFDGLTARAPQPEVPADLVPATSSKPDLRVMTHPGQVGIVFTLEHPQPFPRGRDDRPRRTRLVHLALALAMFQNRLDKQAHADPNTFTASHAALEFPLPGWQNVVVSVTGPVGFWRRIAGDLEKEHRKAFQHGFIDEELRVARANLLLAYEQAERSAASRPSDWLAQALAGHLLAGTLFSTPGDLRRDLAPVVEAATLDDCVQAFRAAWTPQAPHVFLVGHTELSAKPGDLAAVLNNSRRILTERPRASAAVTFAYTDFGAPGTLVRSEHVADLDVRLSEFSNGVRFNFKQTDFSADLVEVRVRVGTGKLSQPIDKPGLDMLASATVAGGGLRRHSAQQLRDLLAGQAVQVSFQVESDAFVFSAHCARRNLGLCLQVIAAYLTDAAYRPEVLRDAHGSFGSLYASLIASPGGPITAQVERLLAGGDPRFGLPDHNALFARTLEEVSAWLKPQFKEGAIEFSVVGDVTWEEALAAAERTLGALPDRKRKPEDRESDRLPPALLTGRPVFYYTNPAVHESALAWFWLVSDGHDIHAERRLLVLAQLIQERLRTRIREQLGASYAPTASLVQHEGFPAFSYLLAYIEVPPPQISQVVKAVEQELQSLCAHPATRDEFQRVLQPMIRAREENLRTNSYWGYTVLRDTQLRPSRLAAARDRAADFAAITSEEIQTLAKRHLVPELCASFRTIPAYNQTGTMNP